MLLTIEAFCKPGGTLIYSGRSREHVEYVENNLSAMRTAAARKKRFVNFLDTHGFSAMFADGVWRYQRFHTAAAVRNLAGRHPLAHCYSNSGKSLRSPNYESGWCIVALNGDHPFCELSDLAIQREFNLPLPGGRSYGRGQEAVEAVKQSRNVINHAPT